ncbi:MAG TPA: type 2 lanthipeptide synthetase LanM family protein [Candidatus Angelobacter sp.]|nr:type 2 lanthipeptide synthetase LanM family protein [Candidatus Angelobacter sp.]
MTPAAGPFVNEAAQRRFSYWREQPPFNRNGLFAKRLAADNITDQDLLYLLSESCEQLKVRFPQEKEWALRPEIGTTTTLRDFDLVPDSLANLSTHPFLYVFKPWLLVGRSRFRSSIQKIVAPYSGLPFDPLRIEDVLYKELPPRILSVVSRTMVLELNVARMRGQLAGETTAERFNAFIERMQAPQVLEDFLKEYPVLERRVSEIVDSWLSASVEFVTHLCADWSAVCHTFFPVDPGALIELHGGLGDLHRGGRSVRKLVFSSGAALIYKPRSLAIDLHYQELLRWINSRAAGFDFKPLSVLNYGDHGWMEYVSAGPCASAQQVTRFYERQGAYLALLHVLNAADFHHENLIAAGEHPILVDLESLFHPVLAEGNAGESVTIANLAIDESVLRTGFLPLRFWAEDGSPGIDLSGLGADPGQTLPQSIPGWELAGTDEMRFVRNARLLPGSHNRPTLAGNTTNVTEHQGALEKGFIRFYRFLLECRAELLAPGGPLSLFSNDEVRAILRPTRTYGSLLTETSHPDVLRDALDRDCLLDRLWIEVEQLPYLAPVVPHEIAQLQRGDIPLFTSKPTSRDLHSATGECLLDFFACTSMEAVGNRIKNLDEEDLNRQLWFIRASLATLRIVGPKKAVYRVKEPEHARPLAELQSSFTAMAAEIGNRLHTLALRGTSSVAWIGLNYRVSEGWGLEPAGLDLYSGLPGIALFLANLGAITEDSRHTELARLAVSTILEQLRDNASRINHPGFCDGVGGLIYALSHLSVLWNAPELIAESKRLLSLLPPLIQADNDMDIVYGSAGCIGALRTLHTCSPSDETSALIRLCGEHLLSRAMKMPAGIAWPCAFSAAQPLTGFSHGAGGISWALMEAASLTGVRSFWYAAMDGTAYERSTFLNEENNWPDFRVGVDGKSPASNAPALPCSPTWCNGAPGIGLSRIGMISHSNAPELMEDLKLALGITLKTGLGLNHSLCHGDMGNIELIIQANELYKTPELLTQLTRAANIVHDSIKQNGWLSGVPKGVETPGLMVGLAGIGYGMLRLGVPDRVPSIVSLGLPVVNKNVPPS